jgi:diacylglycerol O-acyltransferase
MPALSIIDLAMFLFETPERPFNIGPLILLDPPSGEPAAFADQLVATMLKRPVGVPFSYRLHVPIFGMPTLEAAPDANIAAHVHRITLPAPASFEQLSAKVCELHEKRFDRLGLLWDLYVIDGLEGGKVALYGKTHHGIIDGRGFVQAISNWLALSPTDETVRAMWEAIPERAAESPVGRGSVWHARPAMAQGTGPGSQGPAPSIHRHSSRARRAGVVQAVVRVHHAAHPRDEGVWQGQRRNAE